MKDDPIIEEIPKIRKQMDDESGQDPDRFMDNLKKMQEAFRPRLVRRKPKPLVVHSEGSER